MEIISKVMAQTGSQWNNLGLGSASNAVGTGATQGSWQNILTTVTNYVFIIAGVIAFIYLIYSGFIYLTAGGNPDAAKKGQTGILNAIIGLVIIFLAFAIVRFVVSFLTTAV